MNIEGPLFSAKAFCSGLGSASSWPSDAVVQPGSFCRAMVATRERPLSLSLTFSAA
jgi:hypothetical protein